MVCRRDPPLLHPQHPGRPQRRAVMEFRADTHRFGAGTDGLEIFAAIEKRTRTRSRRPTLPRTSHAGAVDARALRPAAPARKNLAAR